LSGHTQLTDSSTWTTKLVGKQDHRLDPEAVAQIVDGWLKGF